MMLLFDSALKATPILAAAWMATLLLRRSSADLRHRIWLAAILAVAVLPALLWIATAALPASMHIVVSASSAVAATRMAHLPWILAIWIAGMTAVLARLAMGHLAIARLTAFSDHIQTPMTWGIFRPAILLPSYMSDWTAEQLEMVLRHERAHIARRDWLWQTIARMVAAVFWFHPLVWIADAQLRREAERAADDCVLREGTDARDYAAKLVEVARRIQNQAPAGAVAMAQRTALKQRVGEILDGRRNRSRTGLAARLAIALCVVALLAPLAAVGQNDRVYKIGEPGVQPPRVLTKVEPQYTEAARDSKIEGRTTLRMIVNQQGRAEDMKVVRSVDEGLDENAMTAVSQWQFAPATRDGKPVRVWATIEVNFHLK